MKHLNLILFNLFIILSVNAQEPNSPITDKSQLVELTGVSEECDCWKAWVELYRNSERVYAIAAECLDQYEFRICVRNTCPSNDESSDILAEIPSRFYSDFRVNGSEIGVGLLELSTNGSANCSNFHPVNNFISGTGTPSTLEISVGIQEWFLNVLPGIRCLLDLSIDIVSADPESSHFYNRIFLEQNIWDHGEIICDYDEKKLCDQPNSTILSRADFTITRTTTATIGAGSSIKTTIKGGVTFPGGIDIGAAVDFSSEVYIDYHVSKSLSNSTTIRIDEVCQGKEDYCVWPGFAVRYNRLRIETWKVLCDGPDVMTDVKYEWIPVDIDHHCCESERCEGCLFLGDHNLNIEKEINGLGDQFKNNSCLGSINLDFDYPESYVVYWAGPNGFESNNEDLFDLELGAYRYTISNCCGDAISGIVELCDDPVKGDWAYNNLSGQYCRVVTCDEEVPTLRSGSSLLCEYEECVTPDRTDFEVVDSDCIEKDYFEEKLLGSRVVGEAEIQVVYNEDIEICIKNIYCSGELREQISDNPILDEWSYDEDRHECVRTVFCFSEPLEESFDDPIFEEEYDGNYHECEIRVDCKGDEITYETDPYDETDWEWSDFWGCERTIECTTNGEEIEVEGEESFDDTEYDEGLDMCYSIVYCDGDEVSGEIKFSSPTKDDWEWETGMSQCERVVYCPYTNETFYEYIDPDFQPTGEDCPDAPQVEQHAVFCDGQDMNTTTCFRNIKVEDRTTSSLSTSNKQEIHVHPNPFIDQIMISGYPEKLKIITGFVIRNNNGMSILRGKVDKKDIDTSSLSPGLYHIELLGIDGVSYRFKIIKH